MVQRAIESSIPRSSPGDSDGVVTDEETIGALAHKFFNNFAVAWPQAYDFSGKDDGPTFPAFKAKIEDTMVKLEAKRAHAPLAMPNVLKEPAIKTFTGLYFGRTGSLKTTLSKYGMVRNRLEEIYDNEQIKSERADDWGRLTHSNFVSPKHILEELEKLWQHLPDHLSQGVAHLIHKMKYLTHREITAHIPESVYIKRGVPQFHLFAYQIGSYKALTRL